MHLLPAAHRFGPGKGVIGQGNERPCLVLCHATGAFAGGGAAPYVVGNVAAGVDEGALCLGLVIHAKDDARLVRLERTAAMHACCTQARSPSDCAVTAPAHSARMPATMGRAGMAITAWLWV